MVRGARVLDAARVARPRRRARARSDSQNRRISLPPFSLALLRCVDAGAADDWAAYTRLLPAYFPRTPREERAAASLLPRDNGDEWGETVMEERAIRVQSFPRRDAAPAPAPGGGGLSLIHISEPTRPY